MFFPDGSWTTKDPVAGKPALAWNDPDDGLTDSPIDLDDVGYVEAEHFIGGNARRTPGSLGPRGSPTGGGEVQPATSKGFATRILVRRPADPVAFNGVVVVEWLNVTSGSDLDALFRPTHTELSKKGCAGRRECPAGRGRRAEAAGSEPLQNCSIRVTPTHDIFTAPDGLSPTRKPSARRLASQGGAGLGFVTVGEHAPHLRQRRAPVGQGL